MDKRKSVLVLFSVLLLVGTVSAEWANFTTGQEMYDQSDQWYINDPADEEDGIGEDNIRFGDNNNYEALYTFPDIEDLETIEELRFQSGYMYDHTGGDQRFVWYETDDKNNEIGRVQQADDEWLNVTIEEDIDSMYLEVFHEITSSNIQFQDIRIRYETSNDQQIEQIPSFIVGQTAEGQLDIQADVYQDYYHDDGKVSYVHATNYFTDVDEGTILEQGEWEDIGLWEKGEADEGSYGTFEVDYSADFQETRFDTGRFAFGVVIVQSENEVDVESLNEDDLSLEDWGEYEHTEIDRVEYEFAVVEADQPLGVIESLNVFFSSITESIVQTLQDIFNDGEIQLPQLEEPPTVE